MKRVSSVVSSMLLAVSWCYGQSSTSDQAQTASQAVAPHVTGHGAFPVKVTKTLDSSKLKQGDAVEVETAGGFKLADGTLVPKGSKLTGQVTEAKARAKGDSVSQLTITFENLNVATGKRVSVKGLVQAVFPPADEIDPGVANAPSTRSNGATPGYVPTSDIKSGSNTGSSTKPQPAADPRSLGVQGLHDLQLADGVLTSGGKQVKLGNGVRMIVHIDILE